MDAIRREMVRQQEIKQLAASKIEQRGITAAIEARKNESLEKVKQAAIATPQVPEESIALPINDNSTEVTTTSNCGGGDEVEADLD